MKDKELSGPNSSTKDASGLRSANEMTDTCPEQGWGGVDNVPGIDPGMSPPLRSSVDAGFDPAGGLVDGPGPNVSMSGDDVDVPLTTLMNVGEEPSEKTGAGLRTAVGTTFNP
jgi:hypothetical protein